MHIDASRTGIDPSQIEDVIVGCVSQTGGQVSVFSCTLLGSEIFFNDIFSLVLLSRLATSDATWSWPASTFRSLYQALPLIANAALLNRLQYYPVGKCISVSFNQLNPRLAPSSVPALNYHSLIYHTKLYRPINILFRDGAWCACQAIHFAAQAVMSGVQDVVVAAGVEVIDDV